ncbi:MAG: hypothetical protein WC497_02455 [Patescibacteria group bacterium]
MKILFEKAFRDNERNLMRQCGYAEFYNRRTGEVSYVRPLRRVRYPQFHIYLERTVAGGLTVNLHLDAKQPTYEDGHAHAGEYDSEVVRDEAQRISSILQSL